MAAFDTYDRHGGRDAADGRPVSTDRGFAVLLMTGAGAEGLNTAGVDEVVVVEPFWHNVLLEQVVGRARRADSHLHIVDPSERVVGVHVLIVASQTVPETLGQKMWARAEQKMADSRVLVDRCLGPSSVEAGNTAGAMAEAHARGARARAKSGRLTARLLLLDAAEGAAVHTRADYVALLGAAARSTTRTRRTG